VKNRITKAAAAAVAAGAIALPLAAAAPAEAATTAPAQGGPTVTTVVLEQQIHGRWEPVNPANYRLYGYRYQPAPRHDRLFRRTEFVRTFPHHVTILVIEYFWQR
jgi:hypothetical protein